MDFKSIAREYVKNRFGVNLVVEVDELEETEGEDIQSDIDPLENQVSQLEEQPPNESEQQVIDLANVLLSALRFDVPDEFKMYTLSKDFRKKTPALKLAWVRNLLYDNPERIVAESDEAPEFGGLESLDIGEVGLKDLLRLVIRALRANPNSYSYTLKDLPSEADTSNYEEVINTIESALF